MKRFFVVTDKAEFFSVVKFIRSRGVRYANEAMACGVERRGYKYNGVFVTMWYGDPSYRIGLYLDNGLHYYYYAESGTIEVGDDNFNLIDIIR